jgi:hypothetical protein
MADYYWEVQRLEQGQWVHGDPDPHLVQTLDGTPADAATTIANALASDMDMNGWDDRDWRVAVWIGRKDGGPAATAGPEDE